MVWCVPCGYGVGSVGLSFFLVDPSFTRMSTILRLGIPKWALFFCVVVFLISLVHLVDDSHY